MQHVYWIIEGKLAGRPGPRRIPWDPAELAAGGIHTVVTVASEEPVEDLGRYGLLHHRVNFLPLPFLGPLTRRCFARRAIPVLAFLHRQIEAGHPTLVHCHDGDDRAGIILAGYLVVYAGLSSDAAVHKVRAANPHAMKMPGYARTVSLFRPAPRE